MSREPSAPDETNEPTRRSSASPRNSPVSILTKGIGSLLRGELSPGIATRELFHRARSKRIRRLERARIDQLSAAPARLSVEWRGLTPAALLEHFRRRETPQFLPGLAAAKITSEPQHRLFASETNQLLKQAEVITREHRWRLLGFQEMDFGDPISWRRDPLSQRLWSLDFHADIPFWHNDGSDIRVLWELNRLAHFVIMGRAYTVSKDEQIAAEFFVQLESWRTDNPVGRGPNWTCAMEVALRAMNLLAAFTLFSNSSQLNEERLLTILALFEQHGSYIHRHLEFSHVATSNHYLSDVVGLLWLGILLPELNAARHWKAWALAEMLREMDKQILPDGADYEASTGYHRFVLELLLYSFILCRENQIVIPVKYWNTLKSMLDYLRAYLRPDGQAPLLGDTDGGQVLPLVQRAADDHGYLLPLGAVVFKDASLKLPQQKCPEELLWILGEEAVVAFQSLPVSDESSSSKLFANAAVSVLRKDDLYLVFNASGVGANGRGSHGHNDALSIEVAAGGRLFITDPGSFVYTADFHQRHLFRSTAWHSTIQVDDIEQNLIDEQLPFVIGNQARPQLIRWETSDELDIVAAEHTGYARLARPVRHTRSVTFYRKQRWWLIEDQLTGEGEHELAIRFQFDTGLELTSAANNTVIARDVIDGAQLGLEAIDLQQSPTFEPRFVSRHYGAKQESSAACWTLRAPLPLMLRWAIVPIKKSENLTERLKHVHEVLSR